MKVRASIKKRTPDSKIVRRKDDAHEFDRALGAGDGQGTLACCSPWGCNESDMTKRLN